MYASTRASIPSTREGGGDHFVFYTFFFFFLVIFFKIFSTLSHRTRESRSTISLTARKYFIHYRDYLFVNIHKPRNTKRV